MATNTPNYNLIKPDGNDPVNIADINGNSDIIDTTLKNLNDRILPLATQAQAQAGTDNTTVMTPLRVLESIVYNGNKFFNSTENNLNNLKKSGNYYFANTVNPSNSPYPNGTAFYIEVLNRNQEDFSIQISHRTNTTEIYTRSLRFDNTWTAWMPLNFNIATQAQAQAGTDNTNLMTPLRTKQAIDNSPIPRYGTATGTNALTITANPLFEDLYTGLTLKFKNTTANTGNVTINVNSKGVKSVLNNDGTQIEAGKLKANALYEITYDGTNFYLTRGGGDSSPIRRVQRGTATINANDASTSVTIPSYNVGKSVLTISSRSSSGSGSGTSQDRNILAETTNNTTLTFSRGISSAYNITVSWELIEYENYVNVQRGTSILSTDSSSTTIGSVDLNKSQLIFSYKSSGSGEYGQNTTGIITNSNTINFARASDEGQNTINWFVVEIK